MTTKGLTRNSWENRQIVGKRIEAYLERFEDDPVISPEIVIDRGGYSETTRGGFYGQHVSHSHRQIAIRYSYRPGIWYDLSYRVALAYLEWLDAGNVGTHLDVIKESAQ